MRWKNFFRCFFFITISFIILFICILLIVLWDSWKYIYLNFQANRLYKAGRYKEAIAIAERSLQLREKACGPEHRDIATGLNNLAALYQQLGALDKALPLYERAFHIFEKTLGPNHPKTATSISNLALLHKAMGAYDRALALQQQAFNIREKVLGWDHPDTASSLNSLAGIYEDMGAYEQALSLYQQALQIGEKTLGTDHPDFAIFINNLANLHMIMGTYDKALALYQGTLQIQEKALGSDHPYTANTLNNMAGLYNSMGNYEKALLLLQRALEIREKTLGTEHPDTAVSLNNLAGLYDSIGRYDKALLLYQRTLEIYQKVLGLNHPKTATIISNLGAVHKEMCAYDKALSLYQMALEIKEKALGPDHPEIAVHHNNLGNLFQTMGSYDKALPPYQRALQIREKALGPEHPDNANILNSLATLYNSMGNYERSLHLHQRALEITEKVLGPDHPDVATQLNNLASIYKTMGAYDKAQALYQRALEITEKSLGPNHPQIASILNNLAGLYELMGKYEQALTFYQRTIEIQEKSLGPDHPKVTSTLNNLGFLHLSLRDFGAAAAFFRRSNSLAGLAELYLVQGQPEVALEFIQKQRTPTLREPVGYKVQYHTQHGLALAGIGRRKEAAFSLLQAVQGVEELRRRTPAEERTRFFSSGKIVTHLRTYQRLVNVLVAMSQHYESLPSALQAYAPDPVAAGFYFAEATKSRVLLEAMAASAQQHGATHIPQDLAQREKDLLNRLAALEAQWEQYFAKGAEVLANFGKHREELRQQLDALVAEIRQKFPRYAALKYPQPLQPKDIPLKKDEILLEYALGEKDSYLFRVLPGGATQVYSLGVGQEEVEGLVKAFMAPLQDKNLQDFSPSQGHKLYSLLLAPALKDLAPHQKLIVVPDGILGLLPLEILVAKLGQDERDSLYVGDVWTITYSQSAAILALNRLLAGPAAGKPLFALGNPIFSSAQLRLARLKAKEGAQLMVAQAHQTGHRALATHKDWGKVTRSSQEGQELIYPPLPYTEHEVKAIADLYGVAKEPPDILLDLQATKTNLQKTPLADYRYLHFATHADLAGKVQGVNEPFLLLCQVDQPEGDDGYLRMSEVLSWRLNADLVVLSACKTGQGKVMAGEGVANLARAFQQAGAKSVVLSLWRVTDQAAMEYMQIFHKHLKAGTGKGEALRLTRQEMKHKYPHPFFWGVFILHGEV